MLLLIGNSDTPDFVGSCLQIKPRLGGTRTNLITYYTRNFCEHNPARRSGRRMTATPHGDYAYRIGGFAKPDRDSKIAKQFENCCLGIKLKTVPLSGTVFSLMLFTLAN